MSVAAAPIAKAARRGKRTARRTSARGVRCMGCSGKEEHHEYQRRRITPDTRRATATRSAQSVVGACGWRRLAAVRSFG
jgi:hypothetical protein